MFLNIKFLEYSEVRLGAKLGDNAITRGNWGDAKSRDFDAYCHQDVIVLLLQLTIFAAAPIETSGSCLTFFAL